MGKIMQSDIHGNESEDDTMSDDERNERLQLKTDRNFIKNKRKNKKRIDLQQQSNENIKKVKKVKNERSNARKKVSKKVKKVVEVAKIESPELSDSPSLSLSDFEEMNNKKIPSVNKATQQILEKFINAYEKKGNITIWLTSLKMMKAEQLSMIKDDDKFVDYLKKLKSNDKYSKTVTEILKKCVHI